MRNEGLRIGKNSLVNLEITGMTSEGNGVGKAEDGMIVFVPDTAVGDIILCRIVKVLKSYCYGIIEKITKPSGDRIKSGCEVSEKCGGCTFRHILYEAELSAKQKVVTDAFKRIGGFTGDYFMGIKGSENTDFYRNKAQYPVAGINGKAVFGFYSKRSHRIIPAAKCRLQPEIFSEIACYCIDYMNRNNIPAYNEQDGSGQLRHIYLRRGHYSGEIMVCLVVKSKKAQVFLEGLAGELINKYPGVKSVVMNINPDNTNVIMGSKNITLKGSGTISDTLCGIKIKLSPMSFYQVNTPQAEKLYAYAKECAALTGSENVLDLYCGAGAVGLYFAASAGFVTGGEVIPEAVENAKGNALDNNITNIEFICGDAGEIAEDLADKKISPDVIVTDPPRKGCDIKTLESIVKMSPSRIVMISCNPATAARDAEYLCGNGYALKKLKAFDLFPRTGHAECVALMTRD